ncbi:hypothetical protein Cfor_00152 [Coptotermes formosanus]|uniref:Uncharacterized protein n=1 Tax=Coptotermes formosanus TaxID=36987 RepID=A0A6L2PQD5_COPFO|nr:hypothetical protein Cfor_00152 [Coptotermes formosanus]
MKIRKLGAKKARRQTNGTLSAGRTHSVDMTTACFCFSHRPPVWISRAPQERNQCDSSARVTARRHGPLHLPSRLHPVWGGGAGVPGLGHLGRTAAPVR